MSYGTAIFFASLFLSLAYCGAHSGMRIDCHDWTAEQCIAFVKAVKEQP